MWNDTDLPLGYLITFRCYGTWLHGDERGSVDRFHNRYKSPYLPRSERRRDLNRNKLKGEPGSLDARQRQSVEGAIREVCEHRQWFLRALNVRTNHVHVVVSIGPVEPERALNAFKAYSTRRMRPGWQLAEGIQSMGRQGAARGICGMNEALRLRLTT